MKPAQKAKQMGLKSLQQALDMGFPRSSLRDMHRNEPLKFEVIILGCIARLKAEAEK